MKTLPNTDDRYERAAAIYEEWFFSDFAPDMDREDINDLEPDELENWEHWLSAGQYDAIRAAMDEEETA